MRYNDYIMVVHEHKTHETNYLMNRNDFLDYLLNKECHATTPLTKVNGLLNTLSADKRNPWLETHMSDDSFISAKECRNEEELLSFFNGGYNDDSLYWSFDVDNCSLIKVNGKNETIIDIMNKYDLDVSKLIHPYERMDKETLYKEILQKAEAAVAAITELPDEIKKEIEVKVEEITKANDEILHGLVIALPDTPSPVVYLEHCWAAYNNGDFDADEMIESFIGALLESYNNIPKFDLEKLQHDNIKDKLTFRVVDAEKNEERLKNLVHRPLDAGFVMIPYITLMDNEDGIAATAISNELAKDFGYDIEETLNTALQNAVLNNEVTLCPIEDMVFGFADTSTSLMDEHFSVERNRKMYVLTKADNYYGAQVLFYPGVKERIAEVLKDDYYVLPSSMHELMVVPVGAGHDVMELTSMVRQANGTVTEPEDVLSDRVLLYDRNKQKLIDASYKTMQPSFDYNVSLKTNDVYENNVHKKIDKKM